MKIRLLPDTLVGRTILVLLAGLLLSQLAALALYSVNRVEMASRLGGRQTAERISAVVRLIESANPEERSHLLEMLDVPNLRVGWGEKPLVGEPDPAIDNPVFQEITSRLEGKNLRTAVFQPQPRPVPDAPAPGFGIFRGPRGRVPAPMLQVAVQLKDGTWLNFVQPMGGPESLWRLGFVAPLVTGLLVVMLLSVLAVRQSARPLQVLAGAAQRLGRDMTSPPIAETGTREVRAAAHAFNEMQTRLRRFVEDRTQMIAAISHDLRTPITRLRLRAEFVEDDEQREKMLTDLSDMETMISHTLAFARNEAVGEARKRVDLAALLAELAGDTGAIYEGPSSLSIQSGPTALKRAFVNLLENPAKYAGDAVVTLSATESSLMVTVEDRGPGIPEDELERVFAPFYRVENSRNRETGGTGLGLAVARSTIRAHGGDIVLSNRIEGGLRATITLPR